MAAPPRGNLLDVKSVQVNDALRKLIMVSG